MVANKSQQTESVVKKLTPSFTSCTRNIDFPFESLPVSFFGWSDCDYKVPKFTYRRSGQLTLSRRNRFARSRTRESARRR